LKYNGDLDDIELRVPFLTEPSYGHNNMLHFPQEFDLGTDFQSQHDDLYLLPSKLPSPYHNFSQQPPQAQNQNIEHLNVETGQIETCSFADLQQALTATATDATPLERSATLETFTTHLHHAAGETSQAQASEASLSPSMSNGFTLHDKTTSRVHQVDQQNLEARFEHIIKAVGEAGFQSIDDMSTQYYTAVFKEDTALYWAQSRSRSRFLHVFLASLHASTNNWSDREVRGYRQRITEAAESFYAHELSSAKQEIINKERWFERQTGDGEITSPISGIANSVGDIWHIIMNMKFSHDFKQRKTIIQERV
jgi:hypothetical protein